MSVGVFVCMIAHSQCILIWQSCVCVCVWHCMHMIESVWLRVCVCVIKDMQKGYSITTTSTVWNMTGYRKNNRQLDEKKCDWNWELKAWQLKDQCSCREHEKKSSLLHTSSHPLYVMKQLSPADIFPASPAAILTNILRILSEIS